MVRNENSATPVKKDHFDRTTLFQKIAVNPIPAIAQTHPQGFIALGANIIKRCTAWDKGTSETYWDP